MAARPAPAFVTGTSSEYLGARPLRRLVTERPVVVVLGPRGCGKSSVGRRIAGDAGREVVELDTGALQQALVRGVRHKAWQREILEADALLLDGPIFLRTRPAPTHFLRQLLKARVAAGRPTVMCEVAQDGSIDLLTEALRPGQVVTVGLRVPESRSGRMRFARRACDDLRIPRTWARGTHTLEPWSYDAVVSDLRDRATRPA